MQYILEILKIIFSFYQYTRTSKSSRYNCYKIYNFEITINYLSVAFQKPRFNIYTKLKSIVQYNRQSIILITTIELLISSVNSIR